MKFIILSLLVASTLGARDPRCPAYRPDSIAVHISHESDCTKFYKCIAFGESVVMQCTEGTAYDHQSQTCGHPTPDCLSTKNHQTNICTNQRFDSKFSLPNDCSSYVTCLPTGPLIQKCGDGLYYDQANDLCDWPDRVACSSSPQQQWPQPQPQWPQQPQKPQWPQPQQPQWPQPQQPQWPYQPQPQWPQPQPQPQWPQPQPQPSRPDYRCANSNPLSPTYFQHPSDCSSYFICDHGSAIERKCPTGQHWNAMKNYCDWPENANCNSGGQWQPLPLPQPHPQPQPQPPRPQQPDGRCPMNDNALNPTHLAHPNDCTKFFVCLNGTPIPKDCPAGQHWSVQRNWCDWPHEANCQRW